MAEEEPDSIFLFLKELGVDLLADKLSPDIVLLGNKEPHLLEDKIDLLSPLH